MDEYLIISNERLIGNSILFWRKSGEGYTTDPYEAGVYTLRAANMLVEACNVRCLPRSEILHLAEHHVDAGKLVEKFHKEAKTSV